MSLFTYNTQIMPSLLFAARSISTSASDLWKLFALANADVLPVDGPMKGLLGDVSSSGMRSFGSVYIWTLWLRVVRFVREWGPRGFLLGVSYFVWRLRGVKSSDDETEHCVSISEADRFRCLDPSGVATALPTSLLTACFCLLISGFMCRSERPLPLAAAGARSACDARGESASSRQSRVVVEVVAECGAWRRVDLRVTRNRLSSNVGAKRGACGVENS